MYINNFLLPLSWSKINIFLQCQRCFYKEQVLKKRRPVIDSDSFSLNNAIDILWKNEFDQYRTKQIPHPLMLANKIDAVPFAHKSIAVWRDYRSGGIKFFDRDNSLELYGIIDDLWINSKNELIIVDYKATAKHKSLQLNNRSKWDISNKRQMAFYASLFKKNGYPVHGRGYFVYSAADKNKPFFNQRLEFETTVQSYEIDDSWIEKTICDIRSCLNQVYIPEPSEGCEFCRFEL